MLSALIPGKGMMIVGAASALAIGWLWLDGTRLAAERDAAHQRADVAEHAATLNAEAAQRIADHAALSLQAVTADRDRALARAVAVQRARFAAIAPGKDCPVPQAMIEALRTLDKR